MSAIITDKEFLSEVVRRIDLHGGKNWIFTNSGTRVFLANPTVELRTLRKMAHAGGEKRFLSFPKSSASPCFSRSFFLAFFAFFFAIIG